MLDMLIGVAQEKGLKTIYGVVLNDNKHMLRSVKKLGFTIQVFVAYTGSIFYHFVV